MLFKCNFIVFKLKRNLISILFLLFTISILIFSNSNLVAVKSGINLWATSVVPSLLYTARRKKQPLNGTFQKNKCSINR